MIYLSYSGDFDWRPCSV